MKTIFSFIASPITIIISLICFFFVLLFESDFSEGAYERMRLESQNLILAETWDSVNPIIQGIIAIAVYYALFF